MATTNLTRAPQWFFGFMLVAALVGCGGGGGSVGGDSGSSSGSASGGGGQSPSPSTEAPALVAQSVSIVNSTTHVQQVFRSIGASTDGGYTVGWIFEFDPTSPRWFDFPPSFYIQRYDTSGGKVGGETRVDFGVSGDSAFTVASATRDSSMAVLSDGGVVMAYVIGRAQPPADPSSSVPTKLGVYFQRFDANGVSVMAEAEVVSRTEVIHSRSSGFGRVRALALADGGFVLGWTLVDGSSVDLKATVYTQRYDSQGQAVGGPLVVGGPASQASYDFAADLRGGYTVSVFTSDAQGNPFATVTHYDANQAARRIVTSVPFGVGFPAFVLPLEGERYVLFASGSSGAYRQMLDAAGNPVGAPVPIPSVPLAAKELIDATFVVFWADGTAQRFASDGDPMGETLRTAASGTARGVVALANVGFALAWSAASAAGDQDVYTQRFIEVP